MGVEDLNFDELVLAWESALESASLAPSAMQTYMNIQRVGLEEVLYFQTMRRSFEAQSRKRGESERLGDFIFWYFRVYGGIGNLKEVATCKGAQSIEDPEAEEYWEMKLVWRILDICD